MSLSPRQERFISEYIKDLHGQNAAIRAGYSPKHAKDQASALLAMPEVGAAVDNAKISRSVRTGIDGDWVLLRLVAEADADIADIFHDDGSILPVSEWPLVFRTGLVAGIESQTKEGETVITKIRFSDRLRRLELIGKHICVNAFQNVIAVQGFTGLAERLERAHARRDAHEAAEAAAKRAAVSTPADVPIAAPIAHAAPPATVATPAAMANDWDVPPPPPPENADLYGCPAPVQYRPIMPLEPSAPWPNRPAVADTNYNPFGE